MACRRRTALSCSLENQLPVSPLVMASRCGSASLHHRLKKGLDPCSSRPRCRFLQAGLATTLADLQRSVFDLCDPDDLVATLACAQRARSTTPGLIAYRYSTCCMSV